MKILDQEPEPPVLSWGALIERIEILRSTLRWATRLERPEIERLLVQCAALRDEALRLSRQVRFVRAAAGGGEAPPAPQPPPTPGGRRRALLERRFVFEGTFGDNPDLLAALEIAEKAAPTELPVLIDGESGTGKELMAKVIHANGTRARRPFISVNCGAIPENLLESELFGHKKGAFTGAAADRKGKFEAADGGTIFLDEIGELPLTGQVKLLRVLESHEIQRVGADEVIPVDARVVAATNRNLRRFSAEGRFREDLFYRLGVIQITLPPLRERRDEIPLLIDYFAGEAADMLHRQPVALSSRLRAFLLDYRWPGNIRELKNLIYRISCLAGDTADLEHLPVDIRPSGAGHSGAGGAQASLTESRRAAGEAAERAFLEKGLAETAGNVAELARRRDMNRTHLQMLLKKHGLSSRDFRHPRDAPMALKTTRDLP